MNMGERPGPPGYPAPMSMLAQPVTGPARWHQNKVTAAAVLFAAAVVAIAGSFVPLFSGQLGFSGESIDMTFTAWGVGVTGGGPFAAGDPGLAGMPKFGYPLVFAGIALLCAATVAAFAAQPAASPGTHRIAGVTAAVGAAFLLGTVWSVALQAVNWVDSFGPLGETELGIESSASYEAGHWLLLCAAALAVIAAVLALLPPRQPDPTADEATPPYGFAMPTTGAPVAYALPTTVDPLTGQPEGPAASMDPLTGLPMPPYDPNPGAQTVDPPVVDPLPGGQPVGSLTGLPADPAPVDPNTGLPMGHPNPAPLVPSSGPAPAGPSAVVPAGAVDQVLGTRPVDPLTLLPTDPAPMDPNTGLPMGHPNPAPLIPSPGPAPLAPTVSVPVGPLDSIPGTPPLDPLTGLPADPAPVNPNTGLPVGHPNPAPLIPSPGLAPVGALDPVPGGQPVDPNTGLPMGHPNPAPLIPTPGPAPLAPTVSVPVGPLEPVPGTPPLDPLTGLPADPAPVNPNTGLPVGHPNPAPLIPSSRPAPAPDVGPAPGTGHPNPPVPESSPRPAVPPVEDPLAEPGPRT